MATTEEINAKIEALGNAIAQGVSSISYDGRTVSYRSLEEMKQILSDLQGQAAAAAGTPKITRKLALYSRGYE